MLLTQNMPVKHPLSDESHVDGQNEALVVIWVERSSILRSLIRIPALAIILLVDGNLNPGSLRLTCQDLCGSVHSGLAH